MLRWTLKHFKELFPPWKSHKFNSWKMTTKTHWPRYKVPESCQYISPCGMITATSLEKCYKPCKLDLVVLGASNSTLSRIIWPLLPQIWQKGWHVRSSTFRGCAASSVKADRERAEWNFFSSTVSKVKKLLCLSVPSCFTSTLTTRQGQNPVWKLGLIKKWWPDACESCLELLQLYWI